MSATQSPEIQRAYRQVICVLADHEREAGYVADLEELKAKRALTRQEQAAIIAYHDADFSSELALSNPLLIAKLTRVIGTLDLDHHVHESINQACWSVLAMDLQDECARRAERQQSITDELNYAHSRQLRTERLMSELGMRGEDFR